MNRNKLMAVATIVMIVTMMGAMYLGDSAMESMRPPGPRTGSTMGLAGLTGLALAFVMAKLTTRR